MSELKACAHCECEMEITKIGRSWWRIRPIDGHDDQCVFDCDHGIDYSQSITIEEACEDWNTRPIEDKLTAEIQQLKEENLLLRECLQSMTSAIDVIWNEQAFTASQSSQLVNYDKAKQLLEETK